MKWLFANSWEAKARILYAGHVRFDKAVAAGKNIDDCLHKEYTKGGHTHCYFPMEQYLAYFDWESLKARKLVL